MKFKELVPTDADFHECEARYARDPCDKAAGVHN
jgi:hypothetical protein